MQICILLTSLLCVIIPLGFVNGILHVLNTQALCLLVPILLNGMFILIPALHTTCVVFVRRQWPPIRKVFYWFHIVCVSITVDVYKPMCIRAFLRRIILISGVLHVCSATCHLWLLVLIMILKVREYVMNDVCHCQMMFFNLTLLDEMSRIMKLHKCIRPLRLRAAAIT